MILIALLLSLISNLCNAQATKKHHKVQSADHRVSAHHKAGISRRNPAAKHIAVHKKPASHKHAVSKHYKRKRNGKDYIANIPVLPGKLIAINTESAAQAIEIRNGSVFINDSFVFKIKSLKHEDDKININFIAPVQLFNSGVNSVGGVGKAELGVFVCNKCDNGALIDDIMPCSPADEAGLQPGDVIVKINDREIDNKNELTKVISGLEPGDNISISYLRYGRWERIFITLDNKSKNLPCSYSKEEDNCCSYYGY